MSSKYLLDTNTLSESNKPQPNKGFTEWLLAMENSDLFTSCLVLGELEKGIYLLNSERKRLEFESWLAKAINDFEGRILDIDQNTSLLWGQLVAHTQKAGKTPQVIDSLLAAQAIQHKLTLVTRNVKDFEQFKDLQVLCPWTNTV